jgi:DNA polymerase elongation subunit (family B)
MTETDTETDTNNSLIPFPRHEAPPITPDEEDIEFQLTDWYLPESDRSADHYRRADGYPPQDNIPEYTMYMYGVTADGHSVSVKVTDFQPYFYIKVPDSWLKHGESGLKGKAREYENMLKYEQVTRTKYNRTTKKREDYKSSIIPYRLRDHLESIRIIKRKEFWGFTNGEDFNFMKIRVKSHALFNILKRFFQEPTQVNAGFKAYESNIDPFLRFIHERNIQPCGWVRLPASMYEFNDAETDDGTPITRAGYNLMTNAKNVYALDINQIAPLLVVSFDIECTSSHGDFPVAKKDYRKLATDLVAAAKDQANGKIYKVNAENVKHWIIDAFTKDTYLATDVTISRVYPLNKVSVKNHVIPVLEKHIDTIVKLVNVAAKRPAEAEPDAEDNADDNAADDDADAEVQPVKSDAPAKRKTGGWGGDDEDGPMGELTQFLTKYLPKLAGDAIIQIGTTVNRFGSDTIIYKNIITLNSCDPIPGADVECFEAEDEVILAWKELIKRLDPDIITGYNIFGFDMKYIWERAEELGIDEHFAVGLGRMSNRRCILDKKELSSAALGDNIMYFFDMDGVIPIDMLKVMQRDQKLDSYKLDNVASVFLGDKKDDISPKDIFEKFFGTSTDRCEVAKYCIQDCALVNRLINKLKVLENNVGMGNVCSVPLSYLFMRGQGIKIFSLVAKEARLKQHLIPVVRSSFDDDKVEDEEGYEGAIVLDPEEGMYLDDPIVVLDYNSLYPSSMISRNLSHDSYVADPESKYGKMQDKGVTYQTVEYDVYEGKGDAKKVVGRKSCVFAQFPDGQKGIIPSILQMLLNQRKSTRKRMEYEHLTLSDGRVAVGLVTDNGDGTLEILNVNKANIGEGFGGHKATINADLVVSRRDEYNKFEQAVLDALQLAYKVTANSLYGQTGSRTSPIYLKEIAACTTATGREMIYLAKNFVEERYDAKVIYGDSVSGDTPLLVRDPHGVVHVKTIECLSKDWIEYENFRPWDERLKDKEQTAFEGEVWANGKWARVIRVIRHKVNKKMYRVNTFQGCVDVTEDHSLVALNGEKIKPGDCVVGETEILHTYPSKFPTVPLMLPRYLKESENDKAIVNGDTFECTKCIKSLASNMFYYAKNGKRQSHCKLCIKQRTYERLGKTFNEKVNKKVLTYDVPSRELCKEEAWVMGIFFGDGSCGNYVGVKKQSWAINNQNLDYLNKAMNYLHMVEPTEIVNFKILDTLKSSGVYKLVAHGSIAYMVGKYRELFYDKDKYKRVPEIIINASQEVREWFLEGYLAADGTKADMKRGQVNFCCKGKIGSMGLYYIVKSIGYDMVNISIRNKDKPNIYWIRSLVLKDYFNNRKDKIMKIHELPEVQEGTYVYDIETSEGKFGGGVGEITLLNTDSIFIKFSHQNVSGEKITGKDALPLAIKAGQLVEKEIKAVMPQNQNLAYEKTLWPFIIFSKKRYVGNLYEDNVNKFKQKSMGIVLKRRDNAPIVKTVYGGILDILLNKNDLAGSVEFLKSQLQNMVDGKVPLEDLIISKTLRGMYKDPSKIAHKVLARRMGERDAGNKPQVNDRIPFVFIKTPEGQETPKLQGDRIEHPDFIRQENLTPDYYHYITNQIMKPVLQMYALCVDKLPGYNFSPDYWIQLDVEMSSHRLYGDEKKRKNRLMALKEREVEDLLFAPYLNQLCPEKAKSAPRSRKKQHALDATDTKNNKANENKPEYILNITYVQESKPKRFNITITLIDTTAANPNTEVWRQNSEIKKNKYQALTWATEQAFKAIFTDLPVVRQGRLKIVTDKLFISRWKTAFNTIDTLTERIEKALANNDSESIEEVNETTSLVNLIGFYDTIPYTLEVQNA